MGHARSESGTNVRPSGNACPSAGPSEGDDGLRWYVAYTERLGEAVAVENLRRQGFGAFCPWITKTVRHARKVSVSLAALFPCYVFVRLNPERDRWRSVNGTRGVTRLITNGDAPAAVPNGVVEAILARADSAGVIDWTSTLEAGDEVRINRGPFTDVVGKLERLSPQGRVSVLIELMGQCVPVQLHRSVLEPK